MTPYILYAIRTRIRMQIRNLRSSAVIRKSPIVRFFHPTNTEANNRFTDHTIMRTIHQGQE